MTIRRNNLAGQTNGATATTTNAATSGDAWTANNLGTGSTAKYSTVSPPTGATVFLELTPAASQIANIDDTTLSGSDFEVEDLFYYSGAPTVNNTLIYQIRGSGGRAIDLAVSTAGKISMQGAAQIGATSTNAFPSAGWYRIRFKAHGDSVTPANGTASYAVFDVSGTAVTGMSGSGTGTINNAPFTTMKRGCTSTTFAVAGNWTVWRYALMQWGTETTDIGPYPTNVPPAASAGPDQTVEPFSTVHLTAAASTDSDGTIASYSWALISNTSGTTPTLSSSSSATPTYTGPGDWHVGSAQTWRVTVTDNLGATATDDVVITVLPSTRGIITNAGTGAVQAVNRAIA